MKKRIISLLLFIVFVILSIFLVYKPTIAACYGTLMIDGVNYGCTDSTPWNNSTPPKGVIVSISDKKIVLENYSGGPVIITSNDYDFDGNYEIELIGNNTIYAKPTEYYTNQNVAFYNIKPTFSGSGTLTIINAEVPFDFRGSDANNSYSVIFKNDSADASEVIQTGDSADAGRPFVSIQSGGDLASAPGSPLDKPADDANTFISFLSSNVGIALLITIPSVLVLIIIILSIELHKKNRAEQHYSEQQKTGIDSLTPNRQI